MSIKTYFCHQIKANSVLPPSGILILDNLQHSWHRLHGWSFAGCLASKLQQAKHLRVSSWAMGIQIHGSSACVFSPYCLYLVESDEQGLLAIKPVQRNQKHQHLVQQHTMPSKKFLFDTSNISVTMRYACYILMGLLCFLSGLCANQWHTYINTQPLQEPLSSAHIAPLLTATPSVYTPKDYTKHIRQLARILDEFPSISVHAFIWKGKQMELQLQWASADKTLSQQAGDWNRLHIALTQQYFVPDPPLFIDYLGKKNAFLQINLQAKG